MSNWGAKTFFQKRVKCILNDSEHINWVLQTASCELCEFEELVEALQCYIFQPFPWKAYFLGRSEINSQVSESKYIQNLFFAHKLSEMVFVVKPY